MKRSWQREDAKKGGPALHTDKNWSEIGFLSVNWAIPEKRWELSTYFFEKKKQLEILEKTKLLIAVKDISAWI